MATAAKAARAAKTATTVKKQIRKRVQLDHEHIAMVLQGGGALGAYQAGVYEEIATIPTEPHWVAGVSIGAINAALIAGNLPDQRTRRLREFWDLVSSSISGVAPMWDGQRQAFHQASAAFAALMGVPGFYQPRVPPPFFQPEGSDAAISFYDTAPLRSTLERLVDFDLINQKKVRLSVGAVNVRTGNSVYFDNHLQKIGPEHIMASGALPPAFAPVEVDGEFYWDGGIVSNTPLQYVLDNRGMKKTLIAQVDLFPARGALPATMPAVMARHKDILYSSRTRFNTDKATELARHKKAVDNLLAKLPARLRKDPDVQYLSSQCRVTHVDIVHLIYRQSRFELESKDYEFSRATVREHWDAGRADMQRTIDHPEWLSRSRMEDGITVYDLSHEHVKS
jgi:NTE family protein